MFFDFYHGLLGERIQRAALPLSPFRKRESE